MDSSQEMMQQTRGKKEVIGAKSNEDSEPASITSNNNTTNLKSPPHKHYTKWLRVAAYILLLLVGQTSGVLLVRLYYDKGGNSKWMATLVQTAGFPILIPLKLYLSTTSNTTTQLPLFHLILLYFVYGVVISIDNFMYSYGLLLIPVSTYSLLCATQLAFNAITSFFINAQKITALVLNSVVILSISPCLLAINANGEGNNAATNHIGRGKFVIGFLCTIGASALCALMLSLIQLSFQKIIKDESFNTVVGMMLYPFFVASCGCVVGLFGSGEWRTLEGEMRNFTVGKVNYVMVLAFATISWQACSVGLLGLIFEVSSLFSNVISTLSLPLVPVLAVVFFHDTMNGVKVISLVLAMWGFLSYIYQHYLDNIEAATKARKLKENASLTVSIEVC